MAGSEEIRSSLAEGLEDISEEEQLKMALELSKNDIFGPSAGFGPSIQPSNTNMSVDSTYSGGAGLEFDDWIRTPAEDRLQLLTGAGEAGRGATSRNVSGSSSEAVKGVSTNDDTYISDNDDEDEDEILKKIIEQSKHDLLISDEEKTKIALEQSELECTNVPMDTLDENEQLEAAIKLSLGATYERLISTPVHRRQSSSISPRSTKSVPPNPTPLPSTSLPNSSSDPSVRPRTRPTSLKTNHTKSFPLAQHPTSSPTDPMHTPPSHSPLPPPSPQRRKFSGSKGSQDNPPEVHFQPPPTAQSAPLPCPPPTHVKQPLHVATSPAAASPPLTEEQQLERALQLSQEEADNSKREHSCRQMSEADQLELALRLSRSESSSMVSVNSRQTSRQSRGSIPAHLAPSQSSLDLPSHLLPCQTDHTLPPPGSPRMVIVDGSNVGMAMGRNQQFRAQALTIVYAWFKPKGHEVVIFLPRSRWNKTRGKDKDLLDTLEKAGILHFTPSRRTDAGCWDSYDDRYIVKYAAQHKGVIVTNDNYRDLIAENTEFRDQIENRLLPFTFIKEEFFPPDDPMGKNGPMLTQFLRH